MSSQTQLADFLEGVDPCYFPSLLYDRGPLQTFDTYTTRLSQNTSTSEALKRDELYRLAFALLLKAYIRSDNILFGFLSNTQLTAVRTPTSPVPRLIKVELNETASLLDNSQELSSFALYGSDGEVAEDQLHELEIKHGFKHFNTVLHLTSSTFAEHPLTAFSDADIVLHVKDDDSSIGNGDIQVTLRYSTEVLGQWCAENVVTTFGSILSTIQSSIHCSLKDINLCSSRDEQIIYSWNAKVPPPANKTLNEHFEKTFHDNMAKEAIYTTDGCFSYGELNDLSTVLATRLINLGVKRNTIVPVCMDKSRWGSCAITAIWKAGGAVTTMDPSHPDERLFAIIEETRATIVITDTIHASRFAKLGIEVIADLEDLPRDMNAKDAPVSRADAWRMSNVQPGDLALVAFTSGSSGKPKGVMHTHNRLTSEHQSYIWNTEYNGGARVLQFGSYAYIAPVGEHFRTFLHGATLCVPSETERTSNLAEFINRSRSTRSYMTPSMIRTLRPTDVPTLKHLVVGGEPVDRDLERLWEGHVHFIQLYGASEGGYMQREQGNPDYQGKGLSPIGGVTWLVDPRNTNKLVPIGAVGEIVFESHELAAGYLNDPEKTAKTFMDTPSWARNRESSKGAKYLRMGDLGRYETDGSVSIYGRADTQVKIHGQRVELKDVEYNLRILLPAGTQVIVEVVKPFDAPDRPILTAFCCFDNSTSTERAFDHVAEDNVTVLNVLRQVEGLLPRHMIPRAIMILEKLPQDYKTDRRKLRTMASNLGQEKLIASTIGVPGRGFDKPLDDKEHILAGLWAKVIGQDASRIGRNDHFFSLGGDSLAAIKLVSLARSNSLELTTQKILESPILKDMANVSTVRNNEPDMHKAVIASSDTEHGSMLQDTSRCIMATDFQEWAVLVGAKNGGWVDHFMYDFSGVLDTEHLRACCHKLVSAHPILGAVFNIKEHRVYMETTLDRVLPFEVHKVPANELESKTVAVCEKDRISPLGTPISRFDLIQVSPVSHRLIIRISHAQYDGLCAEVFEEHLKLLYLSQLLPSTLPFYEYARQIRMPSAIRDAEIYWKHHLKGSQMTKSLQRTPRPHFDNALDSELKLTVVEPNLRSIGISTATIVKAAWALVLSSLSSTSDVVFGDFISGRQVDIPNVETVVGPCVNFMPVRIRTSSKMSNLELLKEIQADSISAIPHETLGFRHIIGHCTDWAQDERFSSIVNFINIEPTDAETVIWNDAEEKKLVVKSMYEEKQHDKTDIWLLCRRGERVQGVNGSSEGEKRTMKVYFRYSQRLYTNGAMVRVANLYRKALDSICKSPGAMVSVPYLSDEERIALTTIPAKAA
ncbi:nonribosomal peptide synthetase 6 [Xylariaceae sp. FL1272]|nr:nonribosomal peptide synthetase 6 [Xylariaceae sp. FL1272]